MTTSGLQTNKTAATFPWMRPAAPFGARAFLLLLFLLLAGAAPVFAVEEASRSEAKATLGALSDRLRVIYQRNDHRADHRWGIDDLGLATKELHGTYFSRENYSMHWDPTRKEVAVFECTGKFADWDEPATVQLEVDLATGCKQFTREPPYKTPPRELILELVLPLGLLVLVCLVVLTQCAQEFFGKRRLPSEQRP